MRTLTLILRSAPLLSLLGLAPAGMSSAADYSASTFGEIAIPQPQKPADAEQCVEPVAVMRRDHMKFLKHQRDATVIDGDRGSRYSLVGCMNCHNPVSPTGEVVRYQDSRHFCAQCHAYASVKLDCFECHADYGVERRLQGRPQPASSFWDETGAALSASTLTRKTGVDR